MLKALGNTGANLVGGLVVMAAVLGFNALYLRMAPAEVFGVISLLLTVTLILPALDFGAGRTAGRLIAGALATGAEAPGLRRSILTLQLCSAAVGLGLGAALAGAAPAIAAHWLDAGSLPAGGLASALGLIAVLIPLMMVRNFAYACLNGMQRQVLSNALLMSFVLAGGVAGVLALHLDAGSLPSFLAAQIAVHSAEAVVAVATAWRLMPGAGAPRPDWSVLRRTWRFAGGDAGATMIGAALAHGDRILLSALLPLPDYGPYALVSTVAAGLGRLTGPFAAAFLPHFVGLTAAGRREALRADYLVATQLLGCAITPVAASMIAFSPEIVATVLGEATGSTALPWVLSMLVAATVLNNLMHLPHGVQLAAGDSVTALRFTAAGGLAYLAMMLLVIERMGILAPALSLLVVQGVSFVFFTRVTHRLLGIPAGRWMLRAMLRPALGAAPAIVAGAVLLPPGIGLGAGAAWVAGTAIAGCAGALAVSPDARRAIARSRGRAGESA